MSIDTYCSIYDGHDFFAHHRRFNYEFEPIKQLGLSTNFMRYAYDFVLLDKENRKYTGDGASELDYYGFNKDVYAAGNGKVVYASNDHKDDKSFDVTKLKKNPLELYGNCIGIQHKNGAISIYGHLKQNSLMVKMGDSVVSGQKIAAIGVSGSSFFPHLHFEVRTSITNAAEGLPSYFSNIYALESNMKIKSGFVETGSIVLTK